MVNIYAIYSDITEFRIFPYSLFLHMIHTTINSYFTEQI